MDALSCVAEEQVDLLLSDLHMPHAGDGFTVVSAMRHTHPQASDTGAQWLSAPEEPELFLCAQKAWVSRVMTGAGHRSLAEDELYHRA
jgi:CheY-like chemotaxis protein